MVNTVNNMQVSETLLENYFSCLVNRFFKILPMREKNEETLNTYLQGLQIELMGCKSFIPEMDKNEMYLSLLNILQYFIDNSDCPIKDVRREVFTAINLCNQLRNIYVCSEVV